MQWRQKYEQFKQKITWKRGVICLGLIVVLFTTATLTYLYGSYQRIVVTPHKPVSDSSPQTTPSPPPDPLRPFGILLLGWGGGTHEGGRLTDTMILAYVEPRREQLTLISLPRDLWVSMPLYPDKNLDGKTNLAYAIGSDDRRYTNKKPEYTGAAGGGELAKEMVRQVTGLSVDHFVSLNFRGFTRSVDTLGGVKVQVPYSFTDEWYPIEGKEADSCERTPEDIAAPTATLSGTKLEQQFPCRYETLVATKGAQLYDGLSALKFVRSRHSSIGGGDAGRTQRQRALLLALKDKIFQVNFLSKALPFIEKLTGDLQTDIGLDRWGEWIAQAETYRTFTIHSISLSEKTVFQLGNSSDGQSILIPKEGEGWESVRAYVSEQLIASPPATPSATISP